MHDIQNLDSELEHKLIKRRNGRVVGQHKFLGMTSTLVRGVPSSDWSQGKEINDNELSYFVTIAYEEEEEEEEDLEK